MNGGGVGLQARLDLLCQDEARTPGLGSNSLSWPPCIGIRRHVSTTPQLGPMHQVWALGSQGAPTQPMLGFSPRALHHSYLAFHRPMGSLVGWMTQHWGPDLAQNLGVEHPYFRLTSTTPKSITIYFMNVYHLPTYMNDSVAKKINDGD